MYPNQPSPMPTPLPTDYLNQIAPQTPKKPLFRFGLKQVIMIGGALVVLVIILSVIVTSVSSGKTDPLQHLAARLTATQGVVTGAQGNLKSSKLRSVNSNLNLFLTNTNRDITAPLTAMHIDTTKLSKNIVTSESTIALSARLENARLNATFDSTYAREMAYQLGTSMTLMNQIYTSTTNTQLKIFLKATYTSLTPTQQSFADYSSANDN